MVKVIVVVFVLERQYRIYFFFQGHRSCVGLNQALNANLENGNLCENVRKDA